MQPFTNERLKLLMQNLANNELSQPINDTRPHPVEDIDLMEAWSFGELDKSQVEEILDHLADCAYCRRSVSAMFHDSIIPFLPVHVNWKEAFITRILRVGSRIARHRLALCAAATILAISVIGLWMFHPQGTDVALGLVSEKTLEDHRRYWGSKSVGVGADSTEEQSSLFRDLTTKNPDDVKLRFKFGQRLLSERLFDDAIVEFEEVAKVAMTVLDLAVVQNELGMARFLKAESGTKTQEEREGLLLTARGHFLEASRLSPADNGIQLNLAICLDMIEYYKKVDAPQ